MDRPNIPLNALRAFEAAARHLTLTHAAVELCVTQAALSHHIRKLEDQLGVALFRRVPRGLVLTDGGMALAPVLTRALDNIGDTLDRFSDGRYHESLNVGVVGTFATGWLIPRLADFQAAHPGVDLRIFTNDNRVTLAAEGLDVALRFGDGHWHGMASYMIMQAPLTPMCVPELASHLSCPEDLGSICLLRSYRGLEWERWFEGLGLACPSLHGPMLDSSLALAEMAAQGHGVALLPHRLFRYWEEAGRLSRPFDHAVDMGSYWLTWPQLRPETQGMRSFRTWLNNTAAPSD